MTSNVFHSLHALLSAFSSLSVPACRFGSADEISQHLTKIDAIRAKVSTDLIAHASELSRLDTTVGVSIINFFSDCGAVIAVSSGLQCALSEVLQGASLGKGAARAKGAALSQEDTHLLVDLWGQVEAAKALFEFTLRHSERFLQGADNQSVSVDGLRAQYKVLLSALEQLMLALGVRFGERVSMADAGAVVDWGLALLRQERYQPLGGAVSQDMFGLVA